MPDNEENITNSDTQTSEQVEQEISFKQRFVSFLKFVYKHKISISITSSTIIIVIVLFSVIPVIPINNLKLVNQDTNVRIEEGQTARLKFNDTSVKIIRFVNEECPAGKTCFGSSQSYVDYELLINGQKYANTSLQQPTSSDFLIETVSSDYKTYAEIRIVGSR